MTMHLSHFKILTAAPVGSLRGSTWWVGSNDNFRVTSFQVKYLEKEKNIAPWKQGSKHLIGILDLLNPRENDTNIKDRESVGRHFRDWVINLVMPYFYETGGYNLTGHETEEEKHVKALLVDMACNTRYLNHKPCRDFAVRAFQKWEAGETTISSFLINKFKLVAEKDHRQTTNKTELSFKTKEISFLTTERSLCGGIYHEYDFVEDEGLDILESCWDEVNNSTEIELLLGNLVGQVVLHKDVLRLRRWRLGRELGKTERIFKQVELRHQAKEKCRDILYKTIKQVFA